MSLFSNPQEVSFRFGDYIEEFQAILSANDIKHGSPDNFSTFTRRLYSDDLLAADLDRMVRSIILRESGNISLRTILSIIAIATGGDEVAEPTRDLSQPWQLLIYALIRSGGCSPTDPDHLDDLCRSAPPIPPSPVFNQSLTRLEHNASEALHYLDSIEQRITRMEPFLEATPFRKTPISSQVVAPVPPPPEPPFIPADPPTLTNHIRITVNDSIDRFADFLFSQKFELRNNFFTDKFTHRSFSFTFTDKLFSHTFTHKLLNYRFSNRLLNYRFSDRLLSYKFSNRLLSYRLSNQFVQRAATLPLSLAAIVGTTLLYLSIEHKNHHSVIQPPPTASTNEASAILPSIAAPNRPQLTVTADPLDGPAAKPQPHKPSPYVTQTAPLIPSHPQRQIEPTPVSPSPSAAASVTTATPAPHTPTEDQTSTLTQPLHSVRYALASSPSKLRASSSRTIDVSSGVMASKLVSATPPAYPKLATLIHMQGQVVMQAIIAENGTVQSLQVLQGHHLLRNAAKNAVRSWRYHPYLIDDKPVEVATIVTVDFNLPH